MQELNAVLPQLPQRRRHAHPGPHQNRDRFLAAAARGCAPHRKLVLQTLTQRLINVGIGHTGQEQVHRLIQPTEFDRPVISHHALAITQSFPPTTRMNGTMASSSVTPPWQDRSSSPCDVAGYPDRKSTRLNSSHLG